MNKKQFFIAGCAVIALLFIAILISLLEVKPQPNPGSVTTNTSATTQALCSTDTSSLAILPTLYTNLPWQAITSSPSAHSGNWISAASSTDKDEVVFLPAVDVGSDFRAVPLAGKGWDAVYTYPQDWGPFWDYYQGELKKDGWSREVNPSDTRILGISADGPSGGETGYVKEQNENVRAIVIEDRTIQGTRYFNVFVSDITPISQIVPGFKSNCQKSDL